MYRYEDLPKLMTTMTGDEKHAPSATSTLDVLWTLYDRVLRLTPETADAPDRDRFLLSKGHGPMAFYAVLAAKGFIPGDKLDLGHQGVGAILVSVGASYDWAAGGYTHHAPGDIACLSTLPGWRLHVPGHADEAESLLRDAATREEPTYLRLSDTTNADPRPVDSDGLKVERLHRSAIATVIAVGPMLDRVREAVSGQAVNLLYASTVRPFDDGTGHSGVAR